MPAGGMRTGGRPGRRLRLGRTASGPTQSAWSRSPRHASLRRCAGTSLLRPLFAPDSGGGVASAIRRLRPAGSSLTTGVCSSYGRARLPSTARTFACAKPRSGVVPCCAAIATDCAMVHTACRPRRSGATTASPARRCVLQHGTACTARLPCNMRRGTPTCDEKTHEQRGSVHLSCSLRTRL
jgi:hypothetical protein